MTENGRLQENVNLLQNRGGVLAYAEKSPGR